MKNLFIELLDTVNTIDRKIIKDFDNPKIDVTTEMISYHEILEQAVHQLKRFKDKAETYAANNP